jgi:hypothetical protein
MEISFKSFLEQDNMPNGAAWKPAMPQMGGVAPQANATQGQAKVNQPPPSTMNVSSKLYGVNSNRPPSPMSSAGKPPDPNSYRVSPFDPGSLGSPQPQPPTPMGQPQQMKVPTQNGPKKK